MFIHRQTNSMGRDGGAGHVAAGQFPAGLIFSHSPNVVSAADGRVGSSEKQISMFLFISPGSLEADNKTCNFAAGR